jgi:hypothetical protein
LCGRYVAARQLVARGGRLESKVNRPDPALTLAVAMYREAIEAEPECGPTVYCHLSRWGAVYAESPVESS